MTFLYILHEYGVIFVFRFSKRRSRLSLVLPNIRSLRIRIRLYSCSESEKNHGFLSSKALFTRYRITYVSDPFSYRIGIVFIRLYMNPIRSAPTIRYNSAPH